MALIYEQVTATKLARHLATMIDQVRLSGKRISITRGHREVAQLIPSTALGASQSVFLALLKQNPLSEDERTSLAKDFKRIRAKAVLPSSSWE